jgi:aminocarboxymuconate-semialdehyde decarboxylase
MRKIDIHTHIIPKDLPDLAERYGYGGFISLCHCDSCSADMLRDGEKFRTIGHNCWDPEVRIAECDASGVTTQALSTIPVMFSYWAKPEHALDLSRFLNDHIAGVCHAHPGRFVGLGTVPMQAPALAIQELERCMAIGLAGIQIGSHIDRGDQDDWNLDQPEVVEVFEAAAELGAAVFVHPWDMMGKDQMSKYWLPWLVGMPAETTRAICSVLFGGVLEKLPSLRLCFAHGGGSFPCTIGRIEHGWRCRPDIVQVDNPTSPRDYLRQSDGAPARIWVDSLVHDHYALRALIGLFGPERVALGTDYPFPLGEQSPGALLASLGGMSAETLEQIQWKTAAGFLGVQSGALHSVS